MAHDLPPLAWLRAFEASARLGTFTRAAEELHLTPSAVSYQVRALEARLGHRLFERGARTLRPTRLGQEWLPTVARAFADLAAATVGVFGHGGGGVVTLRCVSSLGALWLTPRLAGFLARAPELRVRLHTASWDERDETAVPDIDIRYGPARPADATGETLMRHRVIPVAAPALAAEAGALDALRAAPRIEVLGVADTWDRFFGANGIEGPTPRPRLEADQSLIALDLAARGLGHALVADVFAAPFLADGRLVRSAPVDAPAEHAHRLVLPDGARSARPEVARVLDWLRAEAACDGPGDRAAPPAG